jgi:hypothetical protein
MNESRTGLRPLLWVGIAVAFVLLLGGLLTALTPLHLVVRHGSQSQPTLSLNGSQVELVRRPAMSPYDLTIENVSEDDAPVQVMVPFTSLGNRIAGSDVHQEHGAWEYRESDVRFVSTTPGSRLRLKGFATDVTVSFVVGPGQGTVRMDGEEIALHSDTEEIRHVLKPAPRSASLTSRLFALQPLDAAIEGLQPGARVELSVANKLFRQWDVRDEGRVGFHVSRWELAGSIIGLLLAGAGKVALSLGLVAVLALAGIGLVLSWPRATSGWERSTFAASSALALLSVLATSLTYVLSGRITAWIIGLILVGCVVFSVFRLRAHRTPLRPSPPDLGEVLLAVGLMLGIAFAFWPALYMGDWFVGQLQTDAYYYAGLADRIKDQSLIQLDSINGFGMRVLEVVVVGFFSQLLGISTRDAILVSALVSFILAGLLAYVTTLRISRSSTTAGIVALLACLCGPAASLYMEGYYSQYLLVFGLAFCAATGAAIIDRLKLPGTVFAPSVETLAFTVAVVYCLALYPYFALLPVSVVITVLVVRRSHFKAEFLGGVKHLAVALVLLNVNALLLVQIGKTGQFVERLNEIARNVVFPFYKEPRFFSFALGFSPFHASQERLAAVDLEFSNGTLLFAAGKFFLATVNSAPFVLLAVLVLVAALLANWASWSAHPSGRMLVGALAIYLLLAAGMGLRGQVYTYAKIMWTTAALLPFVLVIPLAVSRQPGRIGWRAPLLVGLGLLGGTSLLLNYLNWYGSSAGLALSRSHIALVQDLEQVIGTLETQVAKHPEPSRVAFSDSTFGLRFTDKDRVLLGQLVPALSHIGAECSNCNFSPMLVLVESARGNEACTAGARFVVAMGDASFRCSPEDRVLYAGEFLTLLEAQ